MNIPIWLFVLLIVTNFFTILFLFFFVYLIAGFHDLFLIKYKKEKKQKEAPYFIEKDLPDKDLDI